MESEQSAEGEELLPRGPRLIFGSLLVIALGLATLVGEEPATSVVMEYEVNEQTPPPAVERHETVVGNPPDTKSSPSPSPTPKPDAPRDPEPSVDVTPFPTPAAGSNTEHAELRFRFDHCDDRVAEALQDVQGADMTTAMSIAIEVMECQRNAIEEHYDDPQLFDDAVTFYGAEAEAALVDKFKAAFAKSRPFVMVFGGTSVTAGHDNLFAESWPEVIRQTMQGTFAVAGVKLEVRNTAMGNNPVVPYSFCLADQFGTDADIVGWELGMMMGGLRSGFEMVELYFRNALRFPKRPALLVVGGGRARNPEDKTNKGKPLQPQTGSPKETPMLQRMRGPGSKLPMEVYSQYGTHLLDPNAIYYTRDTRDPFRFKIDGSMKATPRPSDWHPGPLGHQHYGLTLSWQYLRLMEVAARELMEDQTWQPPAAETVEELIPAADCRESPTCELPVACATSFSPRHGAPALEKLVVDGGNWETELYPSDAAGVARAQGYHAHYRDVKNALKIPSPDAGWLAFHFTSSVAGPVAVCQPNANFNKIDPSCGRMPQDAAFRIDGTPVEPPKNQKKASYLMSRGNNDNPPCVVLTSDLPAGEHTVEVSSKRKAIYVSHLLWME